MDDIFDASECGSFCWANGGEGDDILIGGTANDRLSGGKGLDFVSGGEGNDELNGGFDEFADELVGGPGEDVMGKNFIQAIPTGNGSLDYVIIHSENYVDFDPAFDDIAVVELDERFNQTASWSTNSVEKLGGSKVEPEEKRDESKESTTDRKPDSKSSLRNPRDLKR